MPTKKKQQLPAALGINVPNLINEFLNGPRAQTMSQKLYEGIARFDGWEFIKGDPTIICGSCDLGKQPSMYCVCANKVDRFVKDGYKRYHHELKYHSDWNALMPVIEKISKWPLLNADGTSCTDPQDTCFPITFNMPTDDGKVMFRFKGFGLHSADTLIEAAYSAVYEAIQWYNNTLNKQQ